MDIFCVRPRKLTHRILLKTSAPIFIDNRESINEIYKIDTQIISLIVTTDSKLRIEVSK